MSWDAIEGSSWFDIGQNGDTIEVTCTSGSVGGLAPGTYDDNLTFTADGAENSPQTVSVTIVVVQELVRLYVPLVGH